MASPTDPVVVGMIGRIDQLADETLSKIDQNPTGPKEQRCSQYLVEAVNRCRGVLVHCVKTYDRIERKKEAVEQAEQFFPSMQHILDAGVFRELMYSTSLTDRSFHEKFLQLEELAASIDKICGQYVPHAGSNTRPAPPNGFWNRMEGLIDYVLKPGELSPWFNLDEIRGWIARCEKDHSHCKVSAANQQIFQARPTWLVDVQKMCLVRGETGQRYVALSYLCATDGFRTAKNNIADIQKPGALQNIAEAGINGKKIPATILHAMQLTARLGETYLWVDSLCLPHDDQPQLHQELINMGSIFTNAKFTIVVPSTPASAGLYGIQDVTPQISKRQYHRPLWWEKPSNLSKRIEEQQKVLVSQGWGSPWSKRAWTYQEHMFSRKLLILDENSATWNCHCQVYFEGVTAPDGSCGKYEANGQGSKLTSASFKDYATEVSSYNARLLTHQEESLQAFGGIMSTLQAGWRGSWISGLPSAFFDLALLWYNEKPLKKRVATKSGLLAPTWSWAAWQGEVSFLDELKGKNWIKSLADWKFGTAAGSNWTPVVGLQNSSSGAGGHSNRPVDASITNAMAGLDISERSTTDVTSAFSILHLNDSQSPSTIYFTPFLLSARVQHLRLHVMEYSTAGIPLVNKDDECIGMITPHEAITSTTDVKNIVLEVVSVSEMCIDGMELYNVLWIERVDGIALRKGVGRVVKEMWVGLNPEVVDLVLG